MLWHAAPLPYEEYLTLLQEYLTLLQDYLTLLCTKIPHSLPYGTFHLTLWLPKLLMAQTSRIAIIITEFIVLMIYDKAMQNLRALYVRKVTPKCPK